MLRNGLIPETLSLLYILCNIMRVDNNKEVLDIENCWNMDNLSLASRNRITDWRESGSFSLRPSSIKICQL